MQRFTDRVVIVTGASSGIGEATARRFSQEGASVVLAGDTKAKLERVAADLSNYKQVQALVAATVKRFGALHVLFNNAGIAVEGSVTEAPFDGWAKTMATNVGGVFHGCRAAMPHLIASRGCIVNTGSVSGLGGDWALGFYNTSKGAIVNFTKALALDHGKDGVRFNAVCPSLTFTPMTEDMKGDRKLMAKFEQRFFEAITSSPPSIPLASTGPGFSSPKP
ncbi:SDR family oxidoreductase [Variovorax paradoxus]|uniref:SDR family NAD(P)-dependent oxidoreductase n=1 Tax=Variovorax paradoxus TaxID=34073 RepID=UPI00247AC15A